MHRESSIVGAALIAVALFLAAPHPPARAQSLLELDLKEPVWGTFDLDWDVLSTNKRTHIVIPKLPDFVADAGTACKSVPSKYDPTYRFKLKKPLYGQTFPRLYLYGDSVSRDAAAPPGAAAADLFIAVRMPSGEIRCNDNQSAFANFRPGVDVKDAPGGTYDIWLFPVAPPPPDGRMVVGISTNDFPWMPRQGSLILADDNMREPKRFSVSVGGKTEAKLPFPGCPGFIDVPRPDVAVVSPKDGRKIEVSAEADFPFILIFLHSANGAACAFSGEWDDGKQHARSFPGLSEYQYYWIWAGALDRKDIGRRISLQISPRRK